MLEALKKIIEEVGDFDLINAIEADFLTENTARNGKAVLWYYDGITEKAIYIDSLEFLTNEEIENELN